MEYSTQEMLRLEGDLLAAPGQGLRILAQEQQGDGLFDDERADAQPP